MMTMRKYLSLTGLLFAAAALSACEKNAVQDIAGDPPGAAIKFFNFGVNAPSVNFYANDTKITAISSTSGAESTLGTGYGSVGNGGFYSGIAPGQYTFTGKISAATDKDLAVTNVTGTIVDGKYYSLYMSGFYNTTAKTVESFLIEDDFPAQDFAVAYVRFVNAISNSSPMTLYAKNATTAEFAIGGPVAYKTGSAFVAVPNGVYDIATRVAGATTDAIARTAVSFSAGRVYTIGSRGDITINAVTAPTAVNRPFLDNTLNR